MTIVAEREQASQIGALGEHHLSAEETTRLTDFFESADDGVDIVLGLPALALASGLLIAVLALDVAFVA
jgi:hypothetical protein